MALQDTSEAGGPDAAASVHQQPLCMPALAPQRLAPQRQHNRLQPHSVPASERTLLLWPSVDLK